LIQGSNSTANNLHIAQQREYNDTAVCICFRVYTLDCITAVNVSCTLCQAWDYRQGGQTKTDCMWLD